MPKIEQEIEKNLSELKNVRSQKTVEKTNNKDIDKLVNFRQKFTPKIKDQSKQAKINSR